MIASSCIACLVLVLHLSTTTSMATGKPTTVLNKYPNYNNQNPNQLTVGKIRHRLIEMENELEALETESNQHQENPQHKAFQTHSSNVNIEKEEITPKKVKDLSSTDLHSLEEVLSDGVPLKNVNYVGNKIDNDGLDEVNPLDRGSTPSDVEFISPEIFPAKPGSSNNYGPDNLNLHASSSVESMGRFYEKPLADNELGGHVVNAHGIVNPSTRPSRSKQQKGFGAFAKDVLEDVENKLILDLQMAKQHGLTSDDIFKDLEAKRAGKKEVPIPKRIISY